MSGIDMIGGQVKPQGEFDEPGRLGRFYHFVLAALAASQAAIDPRKNNDSMCEIFGAVGWKEGVRLEKYLADHCLVRNINHFVPHAFSLSPYPDGDCPPHFYNHGNDPQIRHFGRLMLYMNRIATLLKSGRSVPETAVLYAAESDWMGECMPPEDIAVPLAENHIAYDFIPADVFSRPERYKSDFSQGLTVNGRKYSAFIVPSCEFIAPCVKKALPALRAAGVKIYEAGAVSPKEIANEIKTYDSLSPRFYPENPGIRSLHIAGDIDMWMFVNEGTDKWTGTVELPSSGECCVYDAWDNGIRKAVCEKTDAGSRVFLTAEPYHSVIVLFGYRPKDTYFLPERFDGNEIPLNGGWKRSVCRAIDYPRFENSKTVSLPDSLASEMPRFSGFVRYENTVNIKNLPSRAEIIVTDAFEGVEVFINGISAGIQIVPEYRFEISKLLRAGENSVAIEVATNSERENVSESKAETLSGITGRCCIIWK